MTRDLFRRLDHIGIAVRSIAKSLQLYENAFGLKISHVEEVAEQKTRTASLRVGATRLELLEATAPDSPIARFLEKRGEGIHHLCFRVDDLRGILKRLKSEGIRLIDQTPRRGADGCLIAFIHPGSTGGVLIELSQAARTPTSISTE